MFCRRRTWLFACIWILAAATVGLGFWLAIRGRPYHPAPMSFDGSSDNLRQTAIVPTLDTPLPEGKSAIWCASFQLAWNRLKDDVVKEPIKLAGAESVADRLNRGDETDEDLNPESVYSVAGLASDGIEDRIRKDMSRKFPKVPSPQFTPGNGAVAYAYLQASVKFDIPFFDNDEPFEFTDSAGQKTAVASFGIRENDDYAYYKLRSQVAILYRGNAPDRGGEVPEFVVDPCSNSRPYQIILAMLTPKATLADSVADVELKTRGGSPHGLGPRDTLLVPNMAWQIAHRFAEIEGVDKPILNPNLQGLHISTAAQVIRFRLDRSGAEVVSESKNEVKPWAFYFHLNRPFLIIMKKRDAKRPFFVVWVDNAELLQKK